MRSPKYGDLNSQTYHFGKSRLVKKLCFGFLGSDSWKEPVGSLTTPLFDLCRQVSFGTACWLLFSFPVRKLLTRAPIPLSSIPRRWWSLLVKRSWFRGIIDRADEPEIKRTGVERALPFVLGPPIHSTPYVEYRIKQLGDRFTSSLVNEWTGVPVQPLKQKIPHRRIEKMRSLFRIGRRVHAWRRLWLAPVLEYVTVNYPQLLVPGSPDWVDDQPGLQVDYRVTRSPIRSPFSFAPRLDEFIPTLCHDGSTIFRAC